MNKVCVIGGATWDVLLTSNEAKFVKVKSGGHKHQAMAFLYGSKIDTTGSEYSFGGGASNVAVGLRRLGVKVDIVIQLGNDWRSKDIINHLKKERVGIKNIIIDKKSYSAISFIITSGGAHEHVAFVDRGATINFKINQRLVSPSYEWYYLTSLANPLWYKYMASFLKEAYQNKKNIFWNPGSLQLKSAHHLKPLLKYLTVLDLNKDEAFKLVYDFGYKVKLIADVLKILHQVGVKVVLVTAGASGAYCFNGQSIVYYPSYHVKPKNTIGAGDAFGSGWLAGYLHSHGDLKQAMKWGMCNSNSVIMKVGAQKGLLRRNQISSFAKKYAQ
ncbi:MAG: carbohydrate kinase family protein [Patescibacteria group bacterium]